MKNLITILFLAFFCLSVSGQDLNRRSQRAISEAGSYTFFDEFVLTRSNNRKIDKKAGLVEGYQKNIKIALAFTGVSKSKTNETELITKTTDLKLPSRVGVISKSVSVNQNSDSVYVLTDDDVVVENGVLVSCSYNFSIADIEIPDSLDGQLIIAIKGETMDTYQSAIFYSKGITSVRLPSKLKTIGSFSFLFNNLTTLDLNVYNELEFVNEYSFYGNNLSEVKIDQCLSLKRIGTYAFFNNALLSSIVLPQIDKESFIAWSDNSFNAYDVLTDFRLELFARHFYTLKDEDVVVESNTIVDYPKSYYYDIIIPNTLAGQVIKSIGDEVFYSLDLKSVKLPETIEYIGTYAFANNQLSEMDFSACQNLVEIDTAAFIKNYDLESVNFNSVSTLKYIENNAFAYCSISALDFSSCSSLVYIGDFSFAENSISNMKINAKESLEYIGVNAIRGSNLDTLDLSGHSKLKYIGDGAFSGLDLKVLNLSGCTSLRLIDDYAFNVNEISHIDLSLCSALEYIGDAAFGNNLIANLDFSDCTSLVSIGTSAFVNNSILSVDLSFCKHLNTIGDNAFVNNSIAHLDIDGLKLSYIGANAFTNTMLEFLMLPSVNYPEFVEWIDGDGVARAVGEKVSLSASYTARIPYTLTTEDVEVEEGVITSCIDALPSKTIVIPDTLAGQQIVAIDDYVFLDKNLLEVELPSALQRIGVGAFRANNIMSLVLPDSIEYIGAYAFNENNLRKVVFDKCISLDTIAKSAFSENNIDSLSLTFCKNLIFLGKSAFHQNSISYLDYLGCTKLDYMGEAVFNSNEISIINGFESEGVFYKCDGNLNVDSSIVISYGGKIQNPYLSSKVTKIAPYAFWGVNVDVDFSKIPLLDSIGDYAFAYCDSLHVNIEANENLRYIGNNTFYWCNIDSLFFAKNSEIKYIGDEAFFGCGIDTVNFQVCESLRSIGDRAFQQNNITNLNLSRCSKLSSIGNAAFRFYSLESVNIDSCLSLVYIGEEAFADGDISSFSLPLYSSIGVYDWVDENGRKYATGDLGYIVGTANSYYARFPYTLTDDDVVVTDGVLDSCYYDFFSERIIIPTVLDGQVVKRIRGNTMDDYKDAIFYSKRITSVQLPDSLEVIGDFSFVFCQIDSLDLTDYSALDYIGDYSFYGNFIKKLGVNEGLRRVGIYSFFQNSIDSVSFENCKDLKSIGVAAFAHNKIKSLNLSNCDSLKEIGATAFYDNQIDSLDLTGCPNLRMIGDIAFRYNSLEKLDLNACLSLDTVGVSAFKSNSLKSVQYAKNQGLYLGESVFNENQIVNVNGKQSDGSIYHFENGVTDSTILISYGGVSDTITIPSQVKKIADLAYSSNGLDSVSFMLCNSLEYIGEYAFTINDIDSIDIDHCQSLSYIGSEAFSENDSLVEFSLPALSDSLYVDWSDGNANTFNSGDFVTEFSTFYKARFIPKASFVVDTTKIEEHSSVQFTDVSINEPTSWLWSFGDDSTSTEQNPTHIYENSGIYTVSLKVSNAVGSDSLVYVDCITIVGGEVNNLSVGKVNCVKLYPNPTNSILNIVGGEDYKIQLINLSGNIVLHDQMTSGAHRIDISALPTGIYLLKLSNDKECITKQIVKE